MGQRFRLGYPDTGPSVLFVVVLLLILPFKTLANDGNIWRSTFGQGWFYEIRPWPDQVLAGTWWEQSLTPGRTYRITFNVQSMRGRFGVLLGDNPIIPIERTGSHSYDFHISEGGKRQMVFRTMSADVVAAVNQISVRQVSAALPSGSGGGNWLPKGHYISFARERNLQSEMVQPLAAPAKAGDYQLRVARGLHDALTTPGVKGAWMIINWRTIEVGDGVFNWKLLDANMAAARKYGLKFVVQIADRSFDGKNILPSYFPSQYVLWSKGNGNGGVVAKRWDPYVYNRLIRLYKAIANRYANDPAFGGVATSETALGDFGASDYTFAKYRNALIQIVTQTQTAMRSGRLFFYLNFLKGGMDVDMSKDGRVQILRDVPHNALVVGGPDITPDVPGMPGSVNSYRIHVRKTMPSVSQFCHLQHVDHGFRGLNVKSNKHRQEYFNKVASIRRLESQYKRKPAIFEFDDLRDPNGNKVDFHPNWVLGQLWKPAELLAFGVRNFDCDYVFWHYREWGGQKEFAWDDVKPVILNNQYFYAN